MPEIPDIEVQTKIANEDIINLSAGLAIAGILIIIVARLTR